MQKKSTMPGPLFIKIHVCLFYNYYNDTRMYQKEKEHSEVGYKSKEFLKRSLEGLKIIGEMEVGVIGINELTNTCDY